MRSRRNSHSSLIGRYIWVQVKNSNNNDIILAVRQYVLVLCAAIGPMYNYHGRDKSSRKDEQLKEYMYAFIGGP